MKRKTAFLSAVMIVLFAFASCGKKQVKEHGESVEIGEYRERFVYEEWDLNASGSVEGRELSKGIFESLDANDDDLLSDEEWGKAEFYFTGGDYGAFNEWDINNDGRLDEEEFETVVNDVGLFDRWDINDDGLIKDQELSFGVFDSFDTDDDGLLDDKEFGNWEDYKLTKEKN